MGEGPQRHRSTCGSSSRRSSDTLPTDLPTTVSTKSQKEWRAAARNIRQVWVGSGRKTNYDPVTSTRNDDHSPASATFLQQLHILHRRAIHTPSYSHGSERQGGTRGKARGTTGVFSDGRYQLNRTPSSFFAGGRTPAGLPRSLILLAHGTISTIDPHLHFRLAYFTIAETRRGFAVGDLTSEGFAGLKLTDGLRTTSSK